MEISRYVNNKKIYTYETTTRDQTYDLLSALFSNCNLVNNGNLLKENLREMICRVKLGESPECK